MLSTRRILFTPTVLVGLLLLPAAAFAQAKIAVIDAVQATPKLKAAERQAIATALDDQGVTMLPLDVVTDADAKCGDPACFAATAKRVGASHLLFLQGVANPAGYRLSLDVREGATGRSLGTDGKDCELCAEDQLAPAVKERVSGLLARVLREQASTVPPAAPAPAPAATSAQASVVVPPSDKRPGLDTSAVAPWYEQRTPIAGLVFTALGAVAIGFGGYYAAVDGNTVEKDKINGAPIILRDTGKWGWSLIGVGAVCVVGGLSAVIWGADDGTSVSVAVNPSSVGLQGKF